MLKWLKQKPNGHHHNSHSSSHHRSPHHQGSHHDAGQNKIITDDPLATIQVHPQHQKKSKNKSEEIYAVSRVNPLFEEEDIPIKPISVGVDAGFRGNNSGSSGYDSGSTSDDGELSKFHRRSNNLHHPDSSSTSSTSSFSVVNRAPSKHGQLFRDEDDPVVHHQAAILGPNGRPVLHIVEQNPDFVQSIAVAVGSAGRPLSPIHELGVSNSDSSRSAIARNHSGNGKVNVHPVPTRSSRSVGSGGEDFLGAAKLIQKDNKFVHSIKIGNGKGSIRVSNAKLSSEVKPQQQPQQQQPPSRVLSSSTPYPPQTTRKPSVTFSERVELVLDDNGNGKLLVKSGGGNIGAIPYRKASAEQDSIVTESLLLMTSRPLGTSDNATGVSNNNANNSSSNSRLFNNSSSNNQSKSGSDGVLHQHQLPHLHRKVSTESSESENNGGGIINRTGSQRREDLEAFSTSIRKNHPVKHILSNSGKSLEISAAADQYSSSEFLDACHAVGDIDSRHYKSSYSEEYSSTSSSDASASSHPNHRDQIPRNSGGGNGNDEVSTRSSSHSPAAEEEEGRKRRPACGKSPFGGIADHYAAAKEIAKEIESYSNGDNANKSSKKIGIVRELLSGRGREALHLHNYSKEAVGSNNNNAGGRDKNGSSPSGHNLSPRHSAGGVGSPSSGKEAWESVRVQQVYLKGRSWKEIQPSSSSSTSSQEGDAGQRVLSVVQQGQVHTNKSNKDRTGSSVGTTTNTASQQSTKQLLKGSIYDGHSSEGGTSNNEGDDDASSDSGHSTDQNSKGSRQDLITERRSASSSTRPKGAAPKPPDPISSIEEDTSSIDKVMIVTGDSKNMVVDLSGVPQDLRDAIIAGTALITLPDGLKSSVSKKGGYTIVSIPTPTNTQPKSKSKTNGSNSSASNSNPNPPNNPSTSSSHPAVASSSSSSSRLAESSANLKSGHPREIEVKAIPIPSSEDLSKLEMGELYGHIFNNYGTKNKTQIWNVMQQSVQQTLIEDEKGKKKRITTILPLHPNQDVYKSPDFTMEGQRQERQRKRLDFAKRRRCVCRVFGIFFFLATFIGVLVALSMIYTKGQRYFGSA